MKFKSFEIGETVKFWQPSRTNFGMSYNCMDIRKGIVKGYDENTKEYLIQINESESITYDASTLSSANGGHYCVHGPCADGDHYECQYLAQCRACQ